jgi:hypothetical protein
MLEKIKNMSSDDINVLYNEVGTQNSISGSMDIVNLLTFL